MPCDRRFRAYSVSLSHVFVSYVREDSAEVERLAQDLDRFGIDVWLDRNRIGPGGLWQDEIRQAIRKGGFFLACFSSAYASRLTSFMNEELALAIEQLRQHPRGRIWFIPVLLNDCEVPDWPIRPGETLGDLQWVELHREWDAGVEQIVGVIAPDARVDQVRALRDFDWKVLIEQIERDKCLPVLGPGVNVGLPSWDVDLASVLAAKGALVGATGNDLSAVVRLVDEALGRGFVEDEVRNVVSRVASPDLADPNELHAVLAELPLSLYFTTAYDTHMEEALRRRNRTPFQETWVHSAWRDDDEPGSSRDWKSASAETRPPEPSIDAPWVVHLRGVVDRPGSLILTDRDQIRFFSAVMRDGYRFFGKPIWFKLLGRTHLYLGHRLDDRTTLLLLESLAQVVGPWRLLGLPPTQTPGGRPGVPLDQFAKELRARWLARAPADRR